MPLHPASVDSRKFPNLHVPPRFLKRRVAQQIFIEARIDEYLLRYTPFEKPWVNLQIGKFATVYGNWVKRHDSWNNPFINAPVPYENVTLVSDQSVPPSPAAFLARKSKPDQKNIWLPILWGPSYTSGASVFGTVESFDYAFE